MTIFQKLSWMVQMGIHDLCGEEVHPLSQKKNSVVNVSVEKSDKSLKKSKSALSMTATHPMSGVGVVPAKVMCVLDMPSASEDRIGEPLSGPEGELLKKMLSAIGLDTKTQTFVGYLSPWRSPGARLLTQVETQEGLQLLNEKIRLVQPETLLLFGMPVVRAMLNIPLGQARTKKNGYNGIPAFATYSPSFLLKNDDYRRGAWEDLKKFQKFLNE